MSTPTKFADILNAATRTPTQEAAAEIQRQLGLVQRQSRASMKIIVPLLDATLDAKGKPHPRATILAEFGDRAPSIQAALDQIGVPASAAPAPTPVQSS